MKTLFFSFLLFFTTLITNAQVQVATIAELTSYKGEATTLVVGDPVRGGLFYLSSDKQTADNGTIFPSNGKKGYWIRSYTKQEGTNVQWFGTKSDGKTDDSQAIQAAINCSEKDGIGKTFIPNGHYLLAKALLIPSNFSLTASKGAYIELKKSCNQYFLRNSNLSEGNENITITGGKWNGNAWTQNRIIREKVENSDFCFGFFFYKVKNLEVGNLQIDSTRSWGIAYMECNKVYIHDIHFEQNPFMDTKFTSALNQNGDGVTGGADNVLIENISGFTNDDLIAFASGGASFKGKMSPFPARDYKNVTVRNIFPQNSHDSIPALKAIAFYTFENTTVSDIIIDNVRGNTAAASVLFYSLFDKTGAFKNVKVSNVSGTNVYSRASHPALPTSYGIITVKNSVIDNISFSGIERTEERYANPQFIFDEKTTIQNLSIRDVHIRHKQIKGDIFMDARKAQLKNVSISNVRIEEQTIE